MGWIRRMIADVVSTALDNSDTLSEMVEAELKEQLEERVDTIVQDLLDQD